MSYNFKNSGNPSVNDSTPCEFCTVKYNDLDHAIANTLKLIELLEKNSGNDNESIVIWYTKSDLKSAFRILPGKVKNFWILIMKAQHPITNQWFYFVDKCLPFGHSISCALFQRFSNALGHITRFVVKDKITDDPLSNYLDDFLFLAFKKWLADFLVQKFLWICEILGVPVSEEKTEWSDTLMTFWECC